MSKASVFPKTVFSMVIPEVEELLSKQADRKSIVLFGIEVRVELMLSKDHSE